MALFMDDSFSLVMFLLPRLKGLNWCHDTQHNDILHNDTQHEGLICDTQHKLDPA
jgi:hypothetical protein